ncbi:MAG: M15 family metallopeptidase [Patescibacteria group bacterium]
MRLKHLFGILGYFFLLGLGIGTRMASPQQIIAQESWGLFVTIPPGEVAQGSVLGAQSVLQAGECVLPVAGDMVLAHVNKACALPASYVPPGLAAITGVPGGGSRYLRAGILPSFYQLVGAAQEAGFNLSVVSAYRSYAAQVATFNYWVGKYGRQIATTFSALPGHSEHQLGTAVDLGLVGDPDFVSFTNHPVAGWVAKNSYKFGFVVSYPKGKQAVTGYIWEPWHVRWVGVDLATKLYKTRLTLEEYLSQL